ncbi:hypothetical protein PHLGIDRAFT_38239 [Phlebiopsis gigantea 11061_1 CR5-6]|uniref:WSC domain-containing protein n=1 Tax=Phlebiopsis gigantea (strain 11061_1 CR5-6) TaxID=745531 RepID=A0A0C3NAS6_PHLG1|nr:hypothetical protein PHLGIDRAFT_38239 [Phlebiopsis gigantea 11061_1 CR5-6]
MAPPRPLVCAALALLPTLAWSLPHAEPAVHEHAHAKHALDKRAPTLPSGWTSLGCYTPHCGNAIGNNGAQAAATDCNFPCTGNPSETCGAGFRLSMFTSGATPPPVGGGIGPVTSGLPAGWTCSAGLAARTGSLGAHRDNAFGRVFTLELPDNSGLTIESCIASCAAQGFSVAGAEFAVQCFCGNELVNGAVTAPDSDCNQACGGSATEACGGPNRLSVYSTGTITALPVPTVQTTGLPGAWQYVGCLEEPGADRTFPYQIINTNNNTAEACLAQCSNFGYPAGGMEFGDECWCGDLSDVTNNSPGLAPATDCSAPCSGDPIHLCGGAQRLTYYTWNGNLNTWHTPANTGYYQFLIGGVVVPLVVTLGINNKIAMLFVLDGPTPSFSHWVRIGGDPGRLGDWPNFPDFTLPGV